MKLSLYSGNLTTYYSSIILVESKKIVHISYIECILELGCDRRQILTHFSFTCCSEATVNKKCEKVSCERAIT